MRRSIRPPFKLSDRFEIQGYFPPDELVELAKDRTHGFVSAWMFTGARAQYLQIMANSCYMQGVNDAIDAMVRGGWKEP